jgi:hypothetical protein
MPLLRVAGRHRRCATNSRTYSDSRFRGTHSTDVTEDGVTQEIFHPISGYKFKKHIITTEQEELNLLEIAPTYFQSVLSIVFFSQLCTFFWSQNFFAGAPTLTACCRLPLAMAKSGLKRKLILSEGCSRDSSAQLSPLDSLLSIT